MKTNLPKKISQIFQIHKKRRIVGRVRCKNIKTECPKVNCPGLVAIKLFFTANALAYYKYL
jgi:hypothetical protein